MAGDNDQGYRMRCNARTLVCGSEGRNKGNAGKFTYHYTSVFSVFSVVENPCDIKLAKAPLARSSQEAW